MTKITIAALAVASALLTPLVVNAAGRTEATKAIVVAEAAVATTGPSQSASAPAHDGCTRRVRRSGNFAGRKSCSFVVIRLTVSALRCGCAYWRMIGGV